MTVQRTGPARGGIIAAIWLIGLGLIFLVKDYANLSWGEAWPMFVILFGVGMLVSSLVGGRRRWAGAWSYVWPLAWIVIGVVLLLSTTGRLGVPPDDLVSQWWPVLPIALGAWLLIASVWPGRARPVETVDIPLAGATAAQVRVRFGAGELKLGRARPGALVAGSFGGGVVATSRGPGAVDLEADIGSGWMGWDRPLAWQVGVTGEVPLELRVDSGAARATLDLGDLQVSRLDLRTGASETTVRLPRAAGVTAVRAESGAASLTIEVPDGVAARIRSRMALGTTTINEARFPRTPEGHASPGFDAAANRVELDLQGGVGTIRVI